MPHKYGTWITAVFVLTRHEIKALMNNLINSFDALSVKRIHKRVKLGLRNFV